MLTIDRFFILPVRIQFSPAVKGIILLRDHRTAVEMHSCRKL